ncbi:MAG: aminopeptidase [Pseudomonadota bacterium]
MRLRLFGVLLVGMTTLSGCYLSHVTAGQLELVSRRQPISALLADPATDEKLRRQLELVRQARAFSVNTLRLPDNASYSEYADLGRPFVVWNVFAAKEFSLEPETSCFLFVGCLAYRGYFEEELAQRRARELAARGLDVHIGAVAAYSTLGWFDDPVLNSMLRWDDDRLVETLFHELAHQQVFIPGDTEFNESFATFVGAEGLRQFRAARREPPPDRLRTERERQFQVLVLDMRARLEALYATPLEADAMRTAKRQEFERLRADYRKLRASWSGYTGYDGWFMGELNNAKLLPVGLYHQWVLAFARLFRQSGRDWQRFYEITAAWATLEPAERSKRLKALNSGIQR